MKKGIFNTPGKNITQIIGKFTQGGGNVGEKMRIMKEGFDYKMLESKMSNLNIRNFK